VAPRIPTLFPVLLLLTWPRASLAQEGPGVPFTRVAIESAGIELPVPVDWVRLPAGEETGAEALFLSVQAKAELDLFSVPFQSGFGKEDLDGRAEEIRRFVSPGASWTDVRVEAVRVEGTGGMVLRAVWHRTDEPADLVAVAFPTRGRTALVLLVMARRGDGLLDLIADLLVAQIHLLEPPAPVEAAPGTYEDGRGFSVTPAAGWRRVAPEELAVIREDAGVDEEAAAEAVAFVRPGILRQSPNVVVDMTPSLMPVSQEMLEEFEIRYRRVLASREGPFTLDRGSIASVAGRDCFLMQGRTEVVGETIRQHQYFVPVEDHYLILTFSVPDAVAGARQADIDAVLASVVIQEPSGVVEQATPPVAGEPGRGTLAFVLGGLAVLAALVAAIAAVRRRSRGR